jgi:ATP-dependent Clp protease adaptor protein ClpS
MRAVLIITLLNRPSEQRFKPFFESRSYSEEMSAVDPQPDTIKDVSLAPLWRVLIHNDDRTPFGFVMGVLVEIFKLSAERSYAITLEAHNGGVALVVVEPREHAEFHVEQAHSLARARKYPLTLTIEPAS